MFGSGSVLPLMILSSFAGAIVGWLLAGLRGRTARSEIRQLNTRLQSLLIDRDRLAKEAEESNGAGTTERGALGNLFAVYESIDHANLRRVNGIGLKLAVVLAGEGVPDLHALAELTEERIADIASRHPLLADRVVRERWREQARHLLGQSVAEPEQLADHPRGSAPQNLTIEIKEPDLASRPKL